MSAVTFYPNKRIPSGSSFFNAVVRTLRWVGMLFAAPFFMSLAALAEPVPTRAPETALTIASATKLKMDFTVSCKEGVASIRLQNRGAAWPETSNLKIFNVDSDALINERKLRLAADQAVSFRFKGASGKSIGIWIETNWYQRPFRYDALVSCH